MISLPSEITSPEQLSRWVSSREAGGDGIQSFHITCAAALGDRCLCLADVDQRSQADVSASLEGVPFGSDTVVFSLRLPPHFGCEQGKRVLPVLGRCGCDFECRRRAEGGRSADPDWQ